MAGRQDEEGLKGPGKPQSTAVMHNETYSVWPAKTEPVIQNASGIFRDLNSPPQGFDSIPLSSCLLRAWPGINKEKKL